MGKTSETKGDTLQHPSVWMEYDFFAWKDRRQPVWVRTYQRINHYYDNINDDTIQAAEYSDGFGRLLQTRALAEDIIFGDATFGSSGLPADPGTANAPAVGIQRGPNTPVNVRVSGWTVYDNKGRPVEQYEPFFSTSFSYQPVQEAQKGQKARMFYDPRGQVVRTLNPDDSEQRVVFGVPNDLTAPPDMSGASGVILSGVEGYKPTPWESYTYDANDLSGITHPTESLAYTDHRWTPSNVLVDALGRTKKATSRLAINDLVELSYEYDIRGNVLGITDALGRIVFRHRYNIANQTLWTEHIDAGTKVAVFDAAGKPVHLYDKGKGSAVYSSYDSISRPLKSYARDYAGEGFKVRAHTVYGDDPSIASRITGSPEEHNYLGKAYAQFDDAGLTVIRDYDFKGNVLGKARHVLSDGDILSDVSTPGYWTLAPFTLDWTDDPFDMYDTAGHTFDAYATDMLYDALNRTTQLTYPQEKWDLSALPTRKAATPIYNRAGLLQGINFDGTDYVRHIAYNAKGQAVLTAMGNDMMTRAVYDPLTFRLKRSRTEKYDYTLTGNTHEYDYLSGNVRQDLVYDYDFVGNILKQTNHTPDSGINGTLDCADKLTRLFRYDPLNRLLEATGRESDNQPGSDLWFDVGRISGTGNALNCRAYRQKYAYDKNGRITRMTHQAGTNGFTRNYLYASGKNMLAEIRDGNNDLLSSFGWDNNGNMATSNTERNQSWDYADRMRAYYNMPVGGSEPSVYARYYYDGAGTRVKKVVYNPATSGFESVTYIDGIFEFHYRSGSPARRKNYYHIEGGVEIRAGGYPDDTEPEVIYQLADHLNSCTARLDDAGGIIDREETYPYGETSMRTFDKKRYRYTGKEKDGESGLYYYEARYYAPWTCAFLSVDPASKETHYQSSYIYADCNPVVFNDPTGMQSPENTPAACPSECNSEMGKTTNNLPSLESLSTYRYVGLETIYLTHNLKKGETIYRVAKEYGVDPTMLKNLNATDGMVTQLPVGFEVRIPVVVAKFELVPNYKFTNSPTSPTTLATDYYSIGVTPVGCGEPGKATSLIDAIMSLEHRMLGDSPFNQTDGPIPNGSLLLKGSISYGPHVIEGYVGSMEDASLEPEFVYGYAKKFDPSGFSLSGVMPIDIKGGIFFETTIEDETTDNTTTHSDTTLTNSTTISRVFFGGSIDRTGNQTTYSFGGGWFGGKGLLFSNNTTYTIDSYDSQKDDKKIAFLFSCLLFSKAAINIILKGC